MKYSFALVSFALVAGLSIGTAFAQDKSTDAPAFSDLAKDGKGFKRGDIPKDNEALKQLRAHFAESDLNKDGKIEEDEYKGYLAKGSQPARN
jgi:hypothetical protein